MRRAPFPCEDIDVVGRVSEATPCIGSNGRARRTTSIAGNCDMLLGRCVWRVYAGTHSPGPRVLCSTARADHYALFGGSGDVPALNTFAEVTAFASRRRRRGEPYAGGASPSGGWPAARVLSRSLVERDSIVVENRAAKREGLSSAVSCKAGPF